MLGKLHLSGYAFQTRVQCCSATRWWWVSLEVMALKGLVIMHSTLEIKWMLNTISFIRFTLPDGKLSQPAKWWVHLENQLHFLLFTAASCHHHHHPSAPASKLDAACHDKLHMGTRRKGGKKGGMHISCLLSFSTGPGINLCNMFGEICYCCG